MGSELVRTLMVIEPAPGNPRNSEGDIIELKDGRLVLAYSRFTGGGHDDSTAHISKRVSADGGKTWTADEVLVPNEGTQNVMSVTLRRLPCGECLPDKWR